MKGQLGAVGGSIPRTYDAIFAQFGGDLPVSFLRALAWNESRLDPDSVSETGATGLLQVVTAVRDDFNAANGTDYERADLHDPRVNVAIASWLLNTIVRSWARNHPATLAPDWSSERYVGLLVLGFNAGWSERAGVAHVVGRLEAEGWTPDQIDVGTVQANAARLGGADKLALEHPMRYARQVAADALREARRAPGGPTVATVTGGAGGALALGLVVGLAVLVAKR